MGGTHLELVVSASVERRGRDDVVASLRNGEDGHSLRRLARGGGDGRYTSFEGGHSLFKHSVCRIPQATIDVTLGVDMTGTGQLEKSSTSAITEQASRRPSSRCETI